MVWNGGIRMFTKEAVKKVVDDMKASGFSLQEIEDNFKSALKAKSIDVNTYFNAMQEIYRED